MATAKGGSTISKGSPPSNGGSSAPDRTGGTKGGSTVTRGGSPVKAGGSPQTRGEGNDRDLAGPGVGPNFSGAKKQG